MQSGKFVNRVFLQFLLLVTIPLIIMGSLSYSVYIKGEKRKNELALKLYCENMVADYENLFNSIREYYLDAVNSDTFKWIVNQDFPPYNMPIDVNKAQSVMQGSYYLMKYISRYNFINYQKGWVLNNYGMFEYSKLRNAEVVQELADKQKANPNFISWQNRADIPSPYTGQQIESNLVDTSAQQLVITEFTGDGEIKWMLLIKLKQNEFDSVMSKFRKLGYEVSVISNGKLFSQTNSALTEGFLAAGSPKSGVIKVSGGESYSVQSVSSSRNDVTYVVGYDYSKNSQGGTAFIYAALAVMLGFALLLIALRYLAMAFSKPVLMLQKYVDDQSAQIKRQFTIDLIRGVLTDEKIKQLVLEFSYEEFASYRMMGVVCKNDENTQPDLLGILRNIPQNVLDSCFSPPVIVNSVLFIIVGDENDLAGDQKTAMAYLHLKDYIFEQHKCQIASGISRPFYHLNHVKRAHQECLETLHNEKHRENSHLSSLVLYDDYGAIDIERNTYDIILENEFAASIEGCNADEAKRILDILLERMQMKGITGVERNFAVTKLISSILTVLTNAGVALNDVFGNDQYNAIQKANTIFDKAELSGYITQNIIAPALEHLEKEQQTGMSDIVMQVMQMIKETNGNITREECAGRLNYHPNYLTKVIAKEKGISFIDLINIEKIKRAKFMLLTTSKSVAEISQELGYTNVQNFIRFFKNQTDTTPSSYRKEQKNDSVK